MPIFLRALSVANSVREWFTFASEAVSFFGVTKRVAAAAVIAAAVAAPIVVASTPATMEQLKDARASVQAAGSAEDDTDISECASGRCSVQYLLASEERLELAKRIDNACATTNDVSQEQCAAAARVVAAIRAVERQERRDAARRKAAAEAPPVGKLTMPWEHKK